MSQPFFGTTHLSLNVWHVKTTNILEFDPLEQVPNPFLRIQFWRISRQLFKMNALGSTFSQKVFDRLTAMDGSAIPDHQQGPRDLTGEQLQKANHIWAFVRMVLGLHEEPAFWSDPTHGRKMVSAQLDAQDGRLPLWRIGADRHRQQVKGGLIYKDDGALFALGLFFSSCQRCSFQAWMAASSRWVAFWMGFCRLCLSERRRRLQWAR